MAESNRKAKDNPEQVEQLIKRHENAGTLRELMNNRGQLNKSHISSLLGFSKSTWGSNPRLSAIADQFNATHGKQPAQGGEVEGSVPEDLFNSEPSPMVDRKKYEDALKKINQQDKALSEQRAEIVRLKKLHRQNDAVNELIALGGRYKVEG